MKSKMKSKKTKFKHGEAVIYDPNDSWLSPDSGLTPNEIVYFLGEIPNAPGHCIVVSWGRTIHPMMHTSDFRKAKENEL